MFLLAVILFATALFLTADNMYQSSIAGESARRVLAQIAEKNPAMADPTTPAMAMPANPAAPMPTTRVNGIDYLGTLVIPSLDLELPIAAECDDERLRVSPCCYAGNYMADDLVICGEGYASHFGRIGLLGIADKARLVTPDGTVIPYIVSNVEIDREDEIDAIMDDWDLTLFTFNMDDTVQVVRLIRA